MFCLLKSEYSFAFRSIRQMNIRCFSNHNDNYQISKKNKNSNDNYSNNYSKNNKKKGINTRPPRAATIDTNSDTSNISTDIDENKTAKSSSISKKKVALTVSYVGSNYYGLQVS